MWVLVRGRGGADAGVWTGLGMAPRWRWLSVSRGSGPWSCWSWWPAEPQEESAGGTPSAPAGTAEPELQEGALGSFFEHAGGDSPGGSTWIARPGREFWGSGAFRKC